MAILNVRKAHYLKSCLARIPDFEIKFGDGIFGKKLGTESADDGNVITVHYMVTDGEDGNGAGGKDGSTDIFRFAGSLQNQNQADITTFLAGSITTNAPISPPDKT